MTYLYKPMFALLLATTSTFVVAAQTQEVDGFPASGPQEEPVNPEDQAPPADDISPTASITISCPNGQSFDLSTGSKRGTCLATSTGGFDNITGGVCRIGGRVVANVSCEAGCEGTRGRGDCSPVTP